MIKAIYLVLKLLSRKCSLFVSFTFYLERITKWWMFFLVLVETNMVGLSFRAFLQLSSPYGSLFRFENKINMVITVLILFVLVFYCFGFYFIVYRYCSRKQS